MGSDTSIQHNPEKNRFETSSKNGRGVLKYEKKGERLLDLQHTYVPRNLRRQGLGGRLVRHALEYARENDYQVIPSCSFVQHYLEENPEFADLAADD